MPSGASLNGSGAAHQHRQPGEADIQKAEQQEHVRERHHDALLVHHLAGGGDQPRPQFGFLPWLAFFFVRSLRLTVLFDMGQIA